MTKLFIVELERAMNHFAEYFIVKYFGRETDWYWIGSSTGAILSVRDYFFDLNQMMDFVRYGFSKQKMFEYYNYALEEHIKGKTPINIRHWKGKK